MVVVAHTVELRSEQLRVEAVGTSRARASALIFPKTGGQVDEVLFGAGELVAAGAPLLKLDAAEEQLALRLARIDVQSAEQLLTRYRRIEVSGAVSDSQIDEAQTAVDAALVALDQAALALDERTVRAPFQGHVGLTDVDAGARIDTSTLITQLDDRRTLFIDFAAPEEVFGYLQIGEAVSVTAFDGAETPLQATIASIDTRVDPVSRSVTIRAALDNERDRLRPGMSFRVLLTYPGTSYPAVPESALLWGSDGPYLWRLVDGVARRVDVALVSREAGYVLVRGNVPAGARIVLEGIQKVRDGSLVSVVAEEGGSVLAGQQRNGAAR